MRSRLGTESLAAALEVGLGDLLPATTLAHSPGGDADK